MAYSCNHFCSSPSTSFRQRWFRSPMLLQPPRTTPLGINPVSLQDSVSSKPHSLNPSSLEISQNPVEKKKNHVWVNPKNPKASHFRRQSYDNRYISLTKVAESLNSCMPVERDVFDILDRNLGGNMGEQDAVIILNNMSNPETAPLVLKYFQSRVDLRREVVLYNVALNVCKKCKDLPAAEKLYDEMLQRGVKPDNVTFSTIITCARLSSLSDKAVEWFEKMPDFGIKPDDLTYGLMIDSYGKAGNVEMALRLYDRSRTENWRVDSTTFSTVIRIHGASGNFDGCLSVFEEMKALGVKPNKIFYNVMLDAMGKAKMPWKVKSFYQEMLSSGLAPSWATYAALIRAYTKAHYTVDAMNVYKEMKAKGMELSVSLYNALLTLCADIGFVDEAVEIFEDLKKSKNLEPDNWTYSAIITAFSCCGKVSEAEAVLKEMREAGFEPTIYILTSLIQCYGKSHRLDDVVRTFDQIIELGITPDERLCNCLLNVMAQTPREELSKLTRCMEKAHSKLGNVVKLLVGDGSTVESEAFKMEAHELLDCISDDVRKAFCNCLIDLSINLDQWVRACELLDLGFMFKIYEEVESKSPILWTLNLKSLSVGAALTALHKWINDLSKATEQGEELPSLLGIHTGDGKHKYSDKELASVLQSRLKEQNAPFHEDPEKVGWFFTTNVAAKSWLKARSSNVVAAA